MEIRKNGLEQTDRIIFIKREQKSLHMFVFYLNLKNFRIRLSRSYLINGGVNLLLNF